MHYIPMIDLIIFLLSERVTKFPYGPNSLKIEKILVSAIPEEGRV